MQNATRQEAELQRGRSRRPHFRGPRRGAPSRHTIRRVSLAGGQVLSLPKTKKIIEHTPHHQKARESLGLSAVRHGPIWMKNGLLSDEKPFAFYLLPNVQNACFVVNKGEEKHTNVLRVPKAADHSCFSLFWVICIIGVVCYHLCTNGFSMQFYRYLLEKLVQPAVKELKEKDGFEPSFLSTMAQVGVSLTPTTCWPRCSVPTGTSNTPLLRASSIKLH